MDDAAAIMTINGREPTRGDMQALALAGYGHFTSMRMENQSIRGLSFHLARLRADCHAVFGAELDLDQVRADLSAAAQRSAQLATIRVTVFDPSLSLGNITDEASPQVLITTRPAGRLSPPPIGVKTFTFTRSDPYIKHVGLFSQLRLRRVAVAAGFDDAAFVEPDGSLSEGATWNLGFVDAQGVVVWPDAPVLPGVTMRLLQDSTTNWQTRRVHLDELDSMQAAFATNVSVGVRAVSVIDDVKYDVDHPVLARLQSAYGHIAGEPL